VSILFFVISIVSLSKNVTINANLKSIKRTVLARRDIWTIAINKHSIVSRSWALLLHSPSEVAESYIYRYNIYMFCNNSSLSENHFVVKMDKTRRGLRRMPRLCGHKKLHKRLRLATLQRLYQSKFVMLTITCFSIRIV